MRHKVLILDTSVMCVWLKVHNMDSCGPEDDQWDYARIQSKIDTETENGATLVLPLATIIETGNHITHAAGDKFESAATLHRVIVNAVNSDSPWAAFTEQSELWSGEKLTALSERWSKELANSGLSLADASIIDVANYYYRSNFEVEILSGDKGLVAYQPTGHTKPAPIPRRRM